MNREALGLLSEILASAGKGDISPCIADLVVNGIVPSRFTEDVAVPNRQDVTQYLACWCLAAGIDEEVCRDWLSGYALSTLRAISRSSPSDIRHSTKCNVRYIYRSSVPFICGKEENPFRASCAASCPLYAVDMASVEKSAPLRQDRSEQPSLVSSPSLPPVLPVKERFREQYKAAEQFIRAEYAKGTSKDRILALLLEQDMKTKTGRSWTLANLWVEIRRLGKRDESEGEAIGSSVSGQ